MCGPYFALSSENTDCASLCCFGFLLLKLWACTTGLGFWLLWFCRGVHIAFSVLVWLCSIFGFYQLKGVVYFWGLQFSIKALYFCCILYQQFIQCISLYNTIPIEPISSLLFPSISDMASARWSRSSSVLPPSPGSIDVAWKEPVVLNSWQGRCVDHILL